MQPHTLRTCSYNNPHYNCVKNHEPRTYVFLWQWCPKRKWISPNIGPPSNSRVYSETPFNDHLWSATTLPIADTHDCITIHFRNPFQSHLSTLYYSHLSCPQIMPLLMYYNQLHPLYTRRLSEDHFANQEKLHSLVDQIPLLERWCQLYSLEETLSEDNQVPRCHSLAALKDVMDSKGYSEEATRIMNKLNQGHPFIKEKPQWWPIMEEFYCKMKHLMKKNYYGSLTGADLGFLKGGSF